MQDFGSTPDTPAPNQGFPRVACDLETFSNPQPFDPENVALIRGRQHQLATPRCGNLLIREPILQFHRRFHANGLKPIPGTPMSQDYPPSDLPSIKKLALRNPFAPAATRGICKIPGQIQAAE